MIFRTIGIFIPQKRNHQAVVSKQLSRFPEKTQANRIEDILFNDVVILITASFFKVSKMEYCKP